MKVVKNWYAVLVLTLIVITYVIFIFNKSTDIETKLDEVKLKTEINEISKNSFAIMVEKEDGSSYEEVDEFPEGLPLNEELTGCIDIDGKKLDNAISYSDRIVTVNVNSTAYCYLYFDYNEPPTITNVTKTSDEQTSITISVVASSDTTIYYYKIDSNKYVSTTSSTYTFEGLTKGTEYSISVYVIDSYGLKSNIVTNVYSTKHIPTLSEQILSNPPTGLNTTLEGGLYRYQGTNVYNYVCFGTSDKDECLGNTDAHMYRIIGVTEDGRIKALKNYALNTAYYWHNSSTSNITWPNSDLYKGLNGISGGKYSNLFIGNTSYMPSGWEDKIEITSWKYGDNTNVNVTADSLYNIENAWGNITNAKIGLIYAHDYAYAYQSNGYNCSYEAGIYGTCKTSWMHISVSDSGAPSQHEWTMSRYGYFSFYSAYYAWRVYPTGGVSGDNITLTNSVRPVFFLKPTVEFIGGTGTSSDPFIIS